MHYRSASAKGAHRGGGSAEAIRVEGLRKRYGEHTAVDGVSFSVVSGEIFAVLGPNGAGKTTTIEILEGYRRADGGQVSIFGMDPIRDAAILKPQLGVMLQQDGIYPTMRVIEALQLFSRYYSDPEPIETMLAQVGLESVTGLRVRTLSGGQKRRLALALALIGKPKLLFLDEPTTGMDPQARRATWEMLLDLKERGVTILLTTHFMDEAERLADRIAILDDGRVLALDTPAALTTTQSTTSTEIALTAHEPLDTAMLGRLPTVRAVRPGDAEGIIIETGDASAALAEITAALRDAGVTLRAVRVGNSSLEDVFLRLTGKEMRS